MKINGCIMLIQVVPTSVAGLPAVQATRTAATDQLSSSRLRCSTTSDEPLSCRKQDTMGLSGILEHKYFLYL